MCYPTRVLTFIAVLTAASGLAARERIDLDRTTPVPATEPIPMADFFRPALLQSPKLNPSGSHIAALVTVGKDRHDLLVYGLADKTVEIVHGNGDKDIYEVHWLNDSRIAYMMATEKLYGMGLMAGDVGSLSQSYPLLQYAGARVVAIPERNRLQPIVWMSYDALETQRDAGVVQLNSAISSGRLVNLYAAGSDWSDAATARDQNDRHIITRYPMPEGMGAGYMADRDGKLAYAFTTRDGVQTLHRFVDGKWLKCPINLDEVDVVSTSDQPGELVVVGARENGKPRALRFMDAATGAPGEILIQDKAYDFRGWVFRDPRSLAIVGAFYDRGGPSAVWFDEGYRLVQKKVEASFPGKVVRITNVDLSGRLLVDVFSDRQPSIYYLVDLAHHSVGLVKSSAPWIDPERMQAMNVMQFKTRDGRRLDAYVTLPPGASKKNPAPLIVLPHGGPWVRDTWGFNGEVQFLASRGYAVMQPNYRGSLGYDWMFPEDDRYAFRKMHDDVTDATKALLSSGLVDPGRVAIMGGSFGAYLALSGVVHEPDLYRCAVTIAGVFDWEQVLNDSKYDQYTSGEYAYLKRRLGDPRTNQERYDAISPLRHIDQMHVPIFVAHGKDDPVADVGESKRLISELDRHHIPHEVLLVGGEGHGMGHLDNRVELYSRVEVFLAKYLSPRPVAVGAAPAGTP